MNNNLNQLDHLPADEASNNNNNNNNATTTPKSSSGKKRSADAAGLLDINRNDLAFNNANTNANNHRSNNEEEVVTPKPPKKIIAQPPQPPQPLPNQATINRHNSVELIGYVARNNHQHHEVIELSDSSSNDSEAFNRIKFIVDDLKSSVKELGQQETNVNASLISTLAELYPHIGQNELNTILNRFRTANAATDQQQQQNLNETVLLNLAIDYIIEHEEEFIKTELLLMNGNSNSTSDSSNGGRAESESGEATISADYDDDDDEELKYLFNEENEEIMKLIAKEITTAATAADSNATVASTSAAVISSPQALTKLRNEFKSDLKKIMVIINDCDPNHIVALLKEHQQSPKRVEEVILHLIDKKTCYPKINNYRLKRQRKQNLESQLNMKLNIEEFLKMHPDPIDYFYKNPSQKSNSYRDHCIVYMSQKYVYFSIESIRRVLVCNENRLAPSIKQLDTAYDVQKIINRVTNVAYKNPKQKILMTKNRFPYKLEYEPRDPNKYTYPAELDNEFFKELAFTRQEAEIRHYLSQKQAERSLKYENSKRLNKLIECQCCFDADLIDEDMVSCPSGHATCQQCLKRYVETQIGDSRYVFKCWTTDCNREYEMKLISQVLEPNVFSRMIRNRQQDEIKQADIANLESCPFCTYAAIVDNPDEKIFYCLNPECAKQTCRACKELNHLPLRCDEAKKSDDDLRVTIENQINEAMIRTCHKCQKRFFKEEGCNMMHCPCGATMCYVCRQPIENYSHFKPGGCPQFSDVHELHKVEMERAYKEALEKLLEENPQFRNQQQQNLGDNKFDPKKLLFEIHKNIEENKKKKPQPIQIQMPHFPLNQPVLQLPRQANAIININNNNYQQQQQQQQAVVVQMNPQPIPFPNYETAINNHLDRIVNLTQEIRHISDRLNASGLNAHHPNMVNNINLELRQLGNVLAVMAATVVDAPGNNANEHAVIHVRINNIAHEIRQVNNRFNIELALTGRAAANAPQPNAAVNAAATSTRPNNQ